MKRKLNFAVIGVGYWGPRYARILSEIDNVDLRWFCDLNQSALENLKKKYPSINLTAKLEEVLEDESVDCVAVVTPPNTHYNLVKKCLLANKNVIVEKPFTINIKDAIELISIAKRKNLTLAVDHTYKFNPAIRKLKDIIQSNSLGDIYYIYGLYTALGPVRREVNALWDLSVHFIYVVNYILQNYPISVTAVGGDFLRNKVEDVVFSNFEYPGKIIFNLHSSWLDPVKTRQLVVVGSKKMVIFDDMVYDNKLKIYENFAEVHSDNDNVSGSGVTLHKGDMVSPKIDDKEPLKEVILDFVNSVLKTTEPFVTAKEGEDIVNILTSTQKSINNFGHKVKITLK